MYSNSKIFTKWGLTFVSFIILALFFTGIIQYNHLTQCAEVLEDETIVRVRCRKIKIPFYKASLWMRIVNRKREITTLVIRWIIRTIFISAFTFILSANLVYGIPLYLLLLLHLNIQLIGIVIQNCTIKYCTFSISTLLEKVWIPLSFVFLILVVPSNVYAMSAEIKHNICDNINVVSQSLSSSPLPLLIKQMKDDGLWEIIISGNFKIKIDKKKPFDLDMIVVILRLLENAKTSKPAFTLQAITQSCGLNSRQAVDNRMKRYREAGNTLSGVAAPFFGRVWQVTEDVRKLIEDAWLENPFLTYKQLQEIIIDSGILKGKHRENIGLRTIREAFFCADLNKFRKAWLKLLVRGEQKVDQEYIIHQLYKIIDEYHGILDQHGLTRKSTKIRLESIKQLLSINSSEVTRKNNFKKGKLLEIQDYLKTGSVDNEDSGLPNVFAALRLYIQGTVSYETTGRMIGRCRSGVWYWVQRFGKVVIDIQHEILPLKNSGAIGIDEKWVKIPKSYSSTERNKGKKWRYVYFALDLNTYEILHSDVFLDNGNNSTRVFLSQLKCLGIKPEVIVTDGLASYESMIPEIYGKKIKHVLCRFHFLQNLHRKIDEGFRELGRDHVAARSLHDQAGALFKGNVQDKRTIKNRAQIILDKHEQFEILTPSIKGFFNALERDLPKILLAVGNPLIPTTNNATENLIRFFTRHYKTMAGFESIESARSYVALFSLFYRLRPFAEGKYAGYCPAEIAGHDLSQIPLFSLLNQPITIISSGSRTELSIGRSPPDNKTVMTAS